VNNAPSIRAIMQRMALSSLLNPVVQITCTDITVSIDSSANHYVHNSHVLVRMIHIAWTAWLLKRA